MLVGNLIACTSLSMLVGSSTPLSMLRAPGIRAQVRNGSMATSTTISSSHMKKSWVAIREDICPSLPIATMTSPWAIMSSRWSAPTSTIGWRLSKRHSKTFGTSYTSTPSGKQRWENASPPFSSTRSRRTRIGDTCSRVSTLTCLSERLQQHLAWGRSPRLPKVSFLSGILLFSLIFEFAIY